MLRFARATFFVVIAMWSGVASAQATFTGLGFLPGLTASRAYGISADGNYVVGASSIAGSVNYQGFRWSLQNGMESLGVAPGGTVSEAFAASANGSVIAARSPAPYPPGTFGTARAAVWTQTTGMVSLGNYSNFIVTYSTQGATGISADGGTIIGDARQSGDNRSYGYLWTSSGFRTLAIFGNGSGAHATGISASGLRVVGDSSTSSGLRAVRWDVSQGTGAIGAISLGTLPGGIYSDAEAISLDGQTIVGHGNTNGVVVPWRWTESGGMVSLGLPAGATEARATAVNGDGSVVVGHSGNFTSSAFMWTPATGAVDLNVYLRTLGIDLTGWTLNKATGVSGDGRVIAGFGQYGGIDQAWVATIPAPATLAVVMLPGFALCRRSRVS